MKQEITSIDEYIMQFPTEVQEILKKFRNVIKEAAPAAEEKISYQMPTFVFHGNLVYFGAFKKHIGFYPTTGVIEAFKHELSDYISTKGTLQFQLNKKIPYELISEIVKYRVKENNEKSELRAKKIFRKTA